MPFNAPPPFGKEITGASKVKSFVGPSFWRADALPEDDAGLELDSEALFDEEELSINGLN
jgi:hypothetical protein